MADKIKYVSQSNLNYYDGKIKTYIEEKDAALKTNLEGQVEVVAGALDSEITRAKAAEATNAAAAQAAQTHSEALAVKVGTVPENQTVMGIITNIQESAYDDSELRGLISGLDTNKADKTQVATDIANAVKVEEDARKEAVAGVQGEVDTLEQTVANNKTAIEGTVSTLEQKVDANETDIEGKMTAITERVAANETAVKTTLPNAISAEQTRAEGKEDELSKAIAAVKEDVDAFFADADMTESAKDTLKELQTYIASDETAASQMAASIKQNADDIDAVEGRLDTVEGKVGTLESEMDEAQSAITALQTAVGDGGSVDEMISDAVDTAITAEETRVDGLLAGKVDKVDGKGLSTNDLTNELKANYDVAYAHSQVAHAPANAQENVIETVKVNGTAVTVTDKAVNIAVPTDNAELTNGAGYLVLNDISGKADKSTTLAGYGISDAYTSAQTDAAIADAIGQFEELQASDIDTLFT